MDRPRGYRFDRDATVAADAADSPGKLQVLVVSSWYPSATDPVAGRFVADQVAALHDRGVVAPAVVSFDPADLIGSGPVRARIARAVHTHVGAAVRSTSRLFVPVATTGPAGPAIPIARLGIPSGRYREAGATHARSARVPALEALADRWVRGLEADVARPALVHAHTVYPDGAAAARLALGLGCPLVLTEHASAVARLIAAPEVRAAYLETVRAAARLIVVSRSLAGELVEAMPEIEPKVVVIPNGVSMDDFRTAPISERRPDELLFVGYRKATKGISTLLRAVALARAGHPGITLRLIGGSPTEEIEAGWRREASDLGIAGIVRFEGPLDRRGVAEAMARASLFVHPSPRETFGVVAVEALASGLPVIAADSGGVTEILGDRPDELGGLVPPDRPELLAAAIGTALDRRESFDPAVLRAAVEARFAAATVAASLEAVYAEASPGPRRPTDAAPDRLADRGRGRRAGSSWPWIRRGRPRPPRPGAGVEPPDPPLALVTTADWIDPGERLRPGRPAARRRPDLRPRGCGRPPLGSRRHRALAAAGPPSARPRPPAGLAGRGRGRRHEGRRRGHPGGDPGGRVAGRGRSAGPGRRSSSSAPTGSITSQRRRSSARGSLGRRPAGCAGSATCSRPARDTRRGHRVRAARRHVERRSPARGRPRAGGPRRRSGPRRSASRRTPRP